MEGQARWAGGLGGQRLKTLKSENHGLKRLLDDAMREQTSLAGHLALRRPCGTGNWTGYPKMVVSDNGSELTTTANRRSEGLG
jgi:hypothetical protein